MINAEGAIDARIKMTLDTGEYTPESARSLIVLRSYRRTNPRYCGMPD